MLDVVCAVGVCLVLPGHRPGVILLEKERVGLPFDVHHESGSDEVVGPGSVQDLVSGGGFADGSDRYGAPLVGVPSLEELVSVLGNREVHVFAGGVFGGSIAAQGTPVQHVTYAVYFSFDDIVVVIAFFARSEKNDCAHYRYHGDDEDDECRSS